MNTLLVGALCFLIVTTLGEACFIDDIECSFVQDESNITVQGNCTAETSYGRENREYFTCPDFRIYFDHGFFEHPSDVRCSPNASPYKYLSKMKSTRNSLTFEDCQLPEHGSIGEGWPEIKNLKFKNYGTIGPLQREHFSGLTKLENLELFINSSHEMPDDLFSDVTKLKKIRLEVGKANKNIFKNLNELEKLQITIMSNESLNDFATSELKNCPSFETFVISGNSFTRVKKQLFVGCSNLDYLHFTHNTIYAFDADAFEPMANLKLIHFFFNKMTSFPEGLLSRNLKLEAVSISYSENLQTLPSGFLSNLPNLFRIKICAQLTSIPSDLIRGSTNLELLDLQDNKLTSLPRDLLQDHSKLREIKLYGNKFYSLSPDHFYNKSPITELLWSRSYTF